MNKFISMTDKDLPSGTTESDILGRTEYAGKWIAFAREDLERHIVAIADTYAELALQIAQLPSRNVLINKLPDSRRGTESDGNPHYEDDDLDTY